MSTGPTRQVCVVVFAWAGAANSSTASTSNPARPITGATLSDGSTIRPGIQAATSGVDESGTMPRLCRSALIAALLLGAAPTAASAATASAVGNTLTFSAAEGEVNQLSVTLASGVYTLTDTGTTPRSRRPRHLRPAVRSRHRR